MRRVALALALIGLVVLAVPNRVVELAAAENPTASNVYAGDAGFTATVGAGSRHFAMRLVNDELVVQHRAGWEMVPGSSVTLYFQTWTTGTGPPAPPSGDSADDCTIVIREENSVSDYHVLHAGDSCPTDGSTRAFYATSNGLSSGTPRAGTFRIVVSATESVAGVPLYSGSSDSNGGKGALRSGTTISSITANAYPAGSTFAYTVAGESITWTVGITPSTSTQLRKYQIQGLDGTNAPPTGFTLVSVTAAAESATFAYGNSVTDVWPAASDNYGLRVVVADNSPLTGVKWTHIHAATSPVVRDSESQAHRPTFYNVDPRITATHLLQVDDQVFGSPPMSKDTGGSRTNDEVGYIATRFTNARGEGLAGASFAFSRTLQDSGAVLAPRTLTGATIGTQGSEVGWSNLVEWNDGAPVGTWLKTVDVTAPSAMDSNAHLLAATFTITLNGGGGGGTIYVNSTEYSLFDPLKVEASPIMARLGHNMTFVVTAMYTDGTARLGAADEIFVRLLAPSGDVVLLDNPTEIGWGVYRLNYLLNESAELGGWIPIANTTSNATLVGVGNTFYVETDTMDIDIAGTDFEGLGIDGFLLALGWLVGLVYFLKQAKSFCAGACTAGFLATIFIAGFGGITQLGALLHLSFWVWVEAVTRDDLYAKILGQKGQKAPGDKKA